MKILLVNDDTDDSLAMQQQLPAKFRVQLASQSQARFLQEKYLAGFDIIVIDNDANDRDEPRGVETLKNIKDEKKASARIYFTSFQPGWVADEVKQMESVEVIKTDKLLPLLAEEFKFNPRPLPDKPKTEPRVTLVISYNPINGYEEGVYKNGRLVVLSYEKNAGREGQRVMQDKLEKIYRKFHWRADRDEILNIFVYDGINGGKWPAQMAAALGHDVRMRVQLICCRCEMQRKREMGDSHYVDLYWCIDRCGGSRELGMIADQVLGVRRPGIDYSVCPVPLNVIEQGAEKAAI